MDVIDELDITQTLLNAVNLSFDHTWQDVKKVTGYIIAYNCMDNSLDLDISVECLERYGKANTPPGMMYVNEDYPGVTFMVLNDRITHIETDKIVIKNTGNNHFVVENEYGEHSYNYSGRGYESINNVIIYLSALGIELSDGIYGSKTRRLKYYRGGHGEHQDTIIKNVKNKEEMGNGWRKLHLNYCLNERPSWRNCGNTKLIEKEPRSLTKPVFIIKTKEEVLARFDEIIAHFR